MATTITTIGTIILHPSNNNNSHKHSVRHCPPPPPQWFSTIHLLSLPLLLPLSIPHRHLHFFNLNIFMAKCSQAIIIKW
jgi:hypothetical protein